MKSEPCVYCGSNRKPTKDHIPPKCLFPKPRPPLITVPCCGKCNTAASLDDEYFRLMITMRDDVYEHPEVQKIWPSVYKSLERRADHGLTRSLIKSIKPVEVSTPNGLFVRRGHGCDVSLARLDRVAARIAIGLFFHEFGQRLPSNYSATAFSESGLVRADQQCIDLVQSNCAKITSRPPKVVGDGVFRYWFGRAADLPDATLWLFTFFDRVSFVCSTGPRDTIPPGHRLMARENTVVTS